MIPEVDTPPIQYVRTSDGYDIAYTDCGVGEPFVFMPMFLGNLGKIWSLPGVRSLLRDLAGRFRLVSYDARGQGLSTRDLSEGVTLDDFILDFEAVRDHLGLERFVMLGSCTFALQAAHYAARHPDQVKALILVNSALSWDAWRLSSVYDHLPAEDWTMFLLNIGNYNLRPEDRTPERLQAFLEFFRDNVTQRDYLVSLPAWRSAGLDDMISQVTVPTLVLHSTHFRLRAVNASLDLTRGLPNGRLAMMESYSVIGERGQAMEAITRFLSDLDAEVCGPVLPIESGNGGTPLTQREMDVLHLLTAGRSNQQIGGELVISPSTVAKHITSILTKTESANRTEAAAYAHRHHLV